MSNHEQILARQDQLTLAQELALPAGPEAGINLVEHQVSAANSQSGVETLYSTYEHHAGGVRGYNKITSKLPISQVYSRLWDGTSTNQYVELELPEFEIMDKLVMQVDGSFTNGSGGTDSIAILPTDQWIDRIELRSGGNVLDTIDGDTVLLERAYRMEDVETKQAAYDLNWGMSDTTSYQPPLGPLTSNDTTLPVTFYGSGTKTFYLDIVNFLSDAQVYGPALRLHAQDMVVRIYVRPSIFSLDRNTTGSQFTVSNVRFWVHEHALNSADKQVMRDSIASMPIAFKGVSRTYFKRSKGVVANSTEYNEVLNNLRGFSAAYMMYLKADANSVQTSATSGPSVNGAVAHYHQITQARLLDELQAPIRETETETQNYRTVQLSHIKHPWYYREDSIWLRWLWPFCSDFSSVLTGVHTGGRQMSGNETVYYTTGADAPDESSSLIIVSYNYASLMCQPSRAPVMVTASST